MPVTIAISLLKALQGLTSHSQAKPLQNAKESHHHQHLSTHWVSKAGNNHQHQQFHQRRSRERGLQKKISKNQTKETIGLHQIHSRIMLLMSLGVSNNIVKYLCNLRELCLKVWDSLAKKENLYSSDHSIN